MTASCKTSTSNAIPASRGLLSKPCLSKDSFAERVASAEAAGIPRERICVDPGFGFGKSLAHNLDLLRRLDELVVPGLPLLVGLSRKSMLGLLSGRAVHERIHAGVAAQVIAVLRGARILRVHDVPAMRDALAVVNAVEDW